MKRFLSPCCLLLLAVWQFGCSKDDVPKQDPKPVTLNKDSVIFATYYPQYLAEAYRFKGRDSVNLLTENPLFDRYRNAASLQFYSDNGYINFWSLSPFANREFPGNALTFMMQIRTNQPTGLRMAWDDEKGTLMVYSTTTSDYLPMVIPGKKAYLETSTFRHYRTWKEAQAAAVKPRMVFIYDDEDPKLGKVTYKITLKPLYEYYREENQQTHAKFVVF
ncbi:hypothetical protein [Dyadobacter sp. 676]|uniref:Uncharacterized protein n=1 Tax=Dyadobacter sp. 676 TaxID=3088362 RepID=A0AAU8FKB8_9BACT